MDFILKKFYITDIRTLTDPKDNPSIMEGLPYKRQEKCLRYIKADDRKRSLGAGKIINQILKDFNCEGKLAEGTNRKPEAEGIFFNVSHSGNYVIGVAADTPIGCDIEKTETAPLEIAHRYFNASEIKYIMSAKSKDLAFRQMWTLKESYMKMTGEGMKLKLDSFNIVIGKEIQVYFQGIKQNCTFEHYIHDGHSIAICQKEL